MKNLAVKLVEIMKSCSHVEKTGTNDYHKYKYATAADVMERFNDALVKNKVASVTESKLLDLHEVKNSKGNSENLATVEVAVTLIDSESGETAVIKAIGSGQDAGDKAVAKAQTMGIKYAYLTSFAVDTGDDAEADISTDTFSAQRKYEPPVNNQRNYNQRTYPATDKPFKCVRCGAPVSQKVADYSKSKFDKVLCYKCQKLPDAEEVEAVPDDDLPFV